MGKIIFSSDDTGILNRNTNVLRVSEKPITYTDKFKKHFIEEYLAGKLPRIIFEEAGFDINMISYKRAEQSAGRWLKAYNELLEGQVELLKKADKIESEVPPVK